MEIEVKAQIEAEARRRVEAETEQLQTERKAIEAQLKAQLEAQKQSGIQALIRTCQSLGQDEAATKAILMKEYELSEEEADKFIK